MPFNSDRIWLIKMLNFKKLRSLMLRIWLPALISLSLIIVIVPSISNASVSPVPSPKPLKLNPKQEIKIIYEALADDIVQILKWMETPEIVPVELAVKMLGYETDGRNVNMSIPVYRGLPSFINKKYQKYKGNTTFNKYLYGRSAYIRGFLRSPQEKIQISYARIYPLNLKSLNIGKARKNWYDNFSAIKFMDYLSVGIEKSRETEIGCHDGCPGSPYLIQTIDLKQKYFKSSKFQKYMVRIISLPTGAWIDSNGEELLGQRNPYITIEIDPK